MKNNNLYIVQGHRGCAGIYPENSIVGFIKAIELGVDALELDIVITKDRQLLISHDPFMNHVFVTKPNGEQIKKEDEDDFNIYEMSIAEAQSYICGGSAHPNFTNQIPLKHHKPSLAELLNELRNYCSKKGLKLPTLSIEIKSHKLWDNKYHPNPEEYSRVIVDELNRLKLTNFIIIGFDARLIKCIYKLDSSIKLAVLNEDPNLSFERVNSELGFIPFAYYPNYKMVTSKLVDQCNELGVQLAVWTVNRVEEFNSLSALGVRNVITDYPNKILNELKNN